MLRKVKIWCRRLLSNVYLCGVVGEVVQELFVIQVNCFDGFRMKDRLRKCLDFLFEIDSLSITNFYVDFIKIFTFQVLSIYMKLEMWFLKYNIYI